MAEHTDLRVRHHCELNDINMYRYYFVFKLHTLFQSFMLHRNKVISYYYYYTITIYIYIYIYIYIIVYIYIYLFYIYIYIYIFIIYIYIYCIYIYIYIYGLWVWAESKVYMTLLKSKCYE